MNTRLINMLSQTHLAPLTAWPQLPRSSMTTMESLRDSWPPFMPWPSTNSLLMAHPRVVRTGELAELLQLQSSHQPLELPRLLVKLSRILMASWLVWLSESQPPMCQLLISLLDLTLMSSTKISAKRWKSTLKTRWRDTSDSPEMRLYLRTLSPTHFLQSSMPRLAYNSDLDSSRLSHGTTTSGDIPTEW